VQNVFVIPFLDVNEYGYMLALFRRAGEATAQVMKDMKEKNPCAKYVRDIFSRYS